jgi:hypothetical protein
MTKPDTPFPKHWLYYILLKCDYCRGGANRALRSHLNYCELVASPLRTIGTDRCAFARCRSNCSIDQQPAQIAIAAFGDAAQPGFAAG